MCAQIKQKPVVTWRMNDGKSVKIACDWNDDWSLEQWTFDLAFLIQFLQILVSIHPSQILVKSKQLNILIGLLRRLFTLIFCTKPSSLNNVEMLLIFEKTLETLVTLLENIFINYYYWMYCSDDTRKTRSSQDLSSNHSFSERTIKELKVDII